VRRFAIVLAALVAAVLGGLATASPAQAAPKLEGYMAVSPYGDKFPGWFWIDEMEGIIGCPKCLHWFDFNKSEVLHPEQEAGLNGGIVAGLGTLSQAHVATDPRTRARLRAEALAQFTAATRALGRAGLRPGPVGYYDPAKDATVETGAAWLAAADEDIADGIGLLQRALAEPDPTPWVEAAAAQFDEAFQEISTKKAIGSQE
jgi:hypothetical protein